MVCVTLSDISPNLSMEVINKAHNIRTEDAESIESLTITRALPPGEGLLSVVFRIVTAGKNQKASFILKAIVKDELLKRSLNCRRAFRREVLFFDIALPVMIEFQRSTGALSNIENIVPKCYRAYSDGDNDYLLLEDLAEGNTTTTFTAKEIRDKTLWTLGHFHAVSIALKHKKPDVFRSIAEKLSEIYFTEDNRDWYRKFLERAVDITTEAIKTFIDDKDIYYKKFVEALSDDIYGQLISLANSKSENCAILHGDVWTSNFYISNARTTMLDFQLLRSGSPALDLSFLIINCKDYGTKTKKEFDEAVDIYYDSLCHHLEDMGLNVGEVYPRSTLDTEMRKFGRFGYLCSLTTIPLFSGATFSDYENSFMKDDKGIDRIPLENLWRLEPLKDAAQKRVVDTLKVAVDSGLI